jgi:hypothetical protein
MLVVYPLCRKRIGRQAGKIGASHTTRRHFSEDTKRNNMSDSAPSGRVPFRARMISVEWPGNRTLRDPQRAAELFLTVLASYVTATHNVGQDVSLTIAIS